jgi:hypothetical protein
MYNPSTLNASLDTSDSLSRVVPMHCPMSPCVKGIWICVPRFVDPLDVLHGGVTYPALQMCCVSSRLLANGDRSGYAAQGPMAKRAGATVTEAKGSYAICISQPEAVADLIALAAEGGR